MKRAKNAPPPELVAEAGVLADIFDAGYDEDDQYVLDDGQVTTVGKRIRTIRQLAIAEYLRRFPRVRNMNNEPYRDVLVLEDGELAIGALRELVALPLVLALVLALALIGCGDNTVTEPDDAVVPEDIYVSPCCALLPDQDAVRACNGPLPPGTCGVIACPDPDGGYIRINVCGPMLDGGV